LEKVLKGIENPQIEIKQYYLEDLRRVDRCPSCHVGIDNHSQKNYPPPYTTHPAYSNYLQNHLPNQFGCSICHQGQGRATTSVEKAHGRVEFWANPLFEGEHTQAACLHCHKDIEELEGAVALQKGDRLLKKSVCFGCHRIDGYEHITKISPPLSHIEEKVSYTWLVKWLLDPSQMMNGASMPKYNFSENDVRAIADYLFGVRQNRRSDELVKEDIDWELYDKGKIIYSQSICSICHKANNRGGANSEMYAPDLSWVGSKVKKEWLKKWLQNPKTYFTNARMSRYRFSDQEINALSEYLIGEYVDWDMEESKLTESVLIEDSSRIKGAALIKEFGCFGCHDIEGMEDIQEIGPHLKIDEIEGMVADELTSFGDKSVEEFDFGKLIEIPRTRIEYLKRKLEDPRSFRDDAKMPLYNYSEEDRSALITLILGFSKEEPLVQYRVEKKDSGYKPPGEFGKIVDDVKCLNCHSIFGKGEKYAPDLSIEGSKVKSEWLINYLSTPDIVRPLSEQMPKFNLGRDMQTTMSKLSTNEIDILSEYILTVLVSEEIPKNLLEGEDISGSEIKRGREVYFQKGCQACHQIGKEGGAVGPALTSVGSRLTPGYIYKHLLNPKIVNRATREPDLGLTEDEALIITKFLLSLNLEL
jgi:mono/diheme cytochrome c family protein